MIFLDFAVKGKPIGHGSLIYIIAEVAWSHDGSLEKAKIIVEGAAKAQADAICFHLTSLEDYMIPEYRVPGSGASAAASGKSLFHFLKEKNLHDSDWKTLFELSKSKNLHILVMANDEPSFRLAEKLGADAYVIAPATMAELELLDLLAKTGKPLFIRTGGATLLEIERTIGVAKKHGSKNLFLIHGFQNFPTPLEVMNISLIDFLKQRFAIPVGFADHTDGSSQSALTIPLVAAGAGADIIEKHITHDRSLKGLDFESALDPSDFAKLILLLRDSEKARGSGEWKTLSGKELHYREVVRKKVVAAVDLPVGKVLSREDVVFRRANEGVAPDMVSRLLGKPLKTEVKKDRGLMLDVVENMKTAIVITVRMKSSRLPRKALLQIKGKTILEHLIDRMRLSKKADMVIVATSTHPDDAVLEEVAKKAGVRCFRGSPEDKLARYLAASKEYGFNYMVDVSADNPLSDPVYVDKVIDEFRTNDPDFILVDNLPLGTGPVGMKMTTVERICQMKEGIDTEAYGYYFLNTDLFNVSHLQAEETLRYPEIRLTIDYPEDYKLMCMVFDELDQTDNTFPLKEVVDLFARKPELLRVNEEAQKRYKANFINLPKAKIKSEFRSHYKESDLEAK